MHQVIGAAAINLHKAFDCFPHEFTLGKHTPYDLNDRYFEKLSVIALSASQIWTQASLLGYQNEAFLDRYFYERFNIRH